MLVQQMQHACTITIIIEILVHIMRISVYVSVQKCYVCAGLITIALIFIPKLEQFMAFITFCRKCTDNKFFSQHSKKKGIERERTAQCLNK